MTYYADTSWWLNSQLRNATDHQAAVGLFDHDPQATVLWTPWQRLEVFNSLHQLERRGDLLPEHAKQVIHRLAGCWRHWGESHGYFDTAEDAQAFYDELAHMLLHQMCAPNSPQWFNTGLHWAYGITGPAQGHFYCDPTTGALKRLSARGLVSRSTSPTDRRAQLCRITPEGEALHAAMERAVHVAHALTTAALSAPDRALLVELLQRVVAGHGHRKGHVDLR